MGIKINEVYPQSSNKPITIPKSFKNQFVARVIGNILGDGCIDKTFTIRYSNTRKELLNYFDFCMKKVFGKSCFNNNVKNNKAGWEYRYSNVCGKLLISHFGQFAYRKSEGKNEKFIPRDIFEWSEDSRWCVIAALIDDEGSVDIEE